MKINEFFGINLSDSGIALFCAFLFFAIQLIKNITQFLMQNGLKIFLGMF